MNALIFKLEAHRVCAENSDVEMIKITDEVKHAVEASGIETGIAFVITMHTTTGITVNENLPCVEKDLLETMERFAPTDAPYHHNHFLKSYGTIGGNTPGHIKGMLTGNHCVYPIQSGSLVLGAAQDIYFVEYDGIKSRTYSIYMMGEGYQK